ncbi:MAG: hypothetical protein KatS3mg031_0966 [Chitinophagales bacterium]|nr:MAG: hypothetical protein KatS3mg031_0966 [Chitinophagales bacterium]
MQNSKLVEVLRTLLPKQLRKLEDLIASPFFNTNQEVLQLFRTLKRYAPGFSHPDLERRVLFKKAFPRQTYDEKKFSYLISDIQRLTDKYLAYCRFSNQPLLEDYYVMQTYIDLGLDKHYKKKMRDARKFQREFPYRDAAFFYNAFLLEELSNTYFDKQRRHAFDESLQNAIDNLDLYYLAQKLKFSCELFNRKKIVAADYKLRLLDEILLYVKEQDFENAPAVAIYYQILMTLTDSENEDHFKKLKELLKKHGSHFSLTEARDMYAYAQNYCIRRINSGQQEYLDELFQLYKTALDRKIIFDGKYISPWTYKNIVGVALRIGQYDWVEKFIHEYKQFLEPNLRENAFAFNLANFYFNIGKYDRTLELLRNVEFTDVVYSLDTKAMLLRIYYELKEFEPLWSLLEAFQVYLRRNKLISDSQKTMYSNLISLTREAIRIPKGDKEAVRKFKDKIENTRQVAYRQWLLEKADELS